MRKGIALLILTLFQFCFTPDTHSLLLLQLYRYTDTLSIIIINIYFQFCFISDFCCHCNSTPESEKCLTKHGGRVGTLLIFACSNVPAHSHRQVSKPSSRHPGTSFNFCQFRVMLRDSQTSQTPASALVFKLERVKWILNLFYHHSYFIS